MIRLNSKFNEEKLIQLTAGVTPKNQNFKNEGGTGVGAGFDTQPPLDPTPTRPLKINYITIKLINFIDYVILII